MNSLPLMRRASYVLAVSCGLFSLAAPRFTYAGNYTRLAEPPTAPALVPLPLGQVQPSGWLRDWAVAARNGITSHLDERSVVFRNAWKGFARRRSSKICEEHFNE